MLPLEANNSEMNTPQFGSPATGWIFLEAISLTTIYEENKCCALLTDYSGIFLGGLNKTAKNFS